MCFGMCIIFVVCLCVSVCICMYVCMCECTYVSVYAFMCLLDTFLWYMFVVCV